MTIELVPCDSDVTVKVSGDLTHQCPYRDEADHGHVEIAWTADGNTFELHSLNAYLAAWRDARLSHEQVTDRIRHDLSTVEGVTNVQVATKWKTAGMEVVVRALSGEPVWPEREAGHE